MKYPIILLVLAAMTVQAEVKVDKLELKGADEASKTAYFAQPIRLWGSGEFMTDPAERVTLVSMSNAKTAFVFSLNGKLTADQRLPASIGMLKPSNANWYANSFFNFEVDKITASECNAEILNAVGGPEFGSFTVRFTNPELQADLKITLRDDDDKLLLEFTPKAANPAVRNYRIGLVCYPSSYGGDFAAGMKLRQREAMTPVRTLPQASSDYRLTPQDCWVLFYDNYFDVKANRGEGPCAFLFNPKEAVSVDVNISNYACLSTLWYPMNQPAFLILWDFNGWSNDGAKDYLKKLKIEL